jgi:hypothetical protein
MSGKQTRYVSYLLRLWQDHNDQKPVWRASLQSSLNGERQVFASLDHLFAFLSRGLDLRSNTDGGNQVSETGSVLSGSQTSE